MSWTLGMIDHLCRLEDQAKAAAGMEHVVLTLKAKNYLYCWAADGKALFRMVNRHLWRIEALYHGGDTFLANFPGALPHQPLWRYRQPRAPQHRQPVSPLLLDRIEYREKQRRQRWLAFREKEAKSA